MSLSSPCQHMYQTLWEHFHLNHEDVNNAKICLLNIYSMDDHYPHQYSIQFNNVKEFMYFHFERFPFELNLLSLYSIYKYWYKVELSKFAASLLRNVPHL